MQRAKALPLSPPSFSIGSRRVLAPPVSLWPLLAMLLLYAGVYLQFAVQLVNFPFDLDQGEGYDAWSAWLMNLGQLPYTSNAGFPYYSSNYPPLWSYLVSIPLAWSGPGLLPARAVSTLAALCASAVLGLAAWQTSRARLAGVLAAGFFLASPYVFHTTPLARVNGLALLLAVTGLWSLQRPTAGRVLVGSLALVAALFTKPTTLDAAIAGLLAVALQRPRLGALGAAVVAGVGGLGLVLLMVLTGGAFWLNVVAGNANPFDSQQLVGYFGNFGLVHCVLIGLAAAEAVWLGLRRQWSPWLFYLVAACLAALSVGKWGAGESYFLGAIAAVCVLSACWVARFLTTSQSASGRLALGAALLIQALLLSHSIVSAAVPWLPDRGPQGAVLGRAPSVDDQAAGQEIVDAIRRANGPVLSEDPSFAVAAGQPVVGNATHLRNLHQAGLWDPSELVADLHARRYAMVILDAELYPEPVLAAIGQFYFQARTVHVNGATYHLFLPGTT